MLKNALDLGLSAQDRPIHGAESSDSHGADLDDVYALSPLQEGMLIHTLREPDASLYFQQTVLAFPDLDVEAFRRAWQRLIDRHGSLRTSFHWEGLERPVQVVHRNAKVILEKFDWQDVSASELPNKLRDLLHRDRRRGLVLTEAPLHRLILLQVGPTAYRVVWSRHHILMDGWSVPILFRELFGLYAAFRQGKDLELPAPRPFREYIAWLQQQDMAGAESFWKRVFAGFTIPTPLPGDQTAPGTGRGERFGQQAAELNEAITGELQALARQHQSHAQYYRARRLGAAIALPHQLG